MVCPWQTKTVERVSKLEYSEEKETKVEFSDCCLEKCPFYVKPHLIHGGCYWLKGYCSRNA